MATLATQRGRLSTGRAAAVLIRPYLLAGGLAAAAGFALLGVLAQEGSQLQPASAR